MSDLSEYFGGCSHYSKREMDKMTINARCLGMMEKMIVGKQLVKMYKSDVKKERRKYFPMEDWVKVMYNKYS